MPEVSITKIPHLDLVVIKQRGVHFFIAAPDSIVIDKAGYLQLLYQLMNVGFVSSDEIYNLVIRKDFEDANKENSSNTGVG